MRFETTPDDIHGVIQAQGVVDRPRRHDVARRRRRPGNGQAVRVRRRVARHRPGGAPVHGERHDVSEGDEISVDGGRGLVIRGAVQLVPPQINEDFRAITGWADEVRRLGVRANADTPEDATGRASSAPRASACAAPSTCSSATSGCR